jgi:hypothetical protein
MLSSIITAETPHLSRVFTLADLAWCPNDDEMKNDSFDDYD